MTKSGGVILIGVGLASAFLGYYFSQSMMRTTQSRSSDPSVAESSPTYTTRIPFSAVPSADLKNMIVVTRIHQKEASKMIEIDKVISFVRSSLDYASKVLVCTGLMHSGNNLYWNDLRTKLKELGLENSTEVLSIDPWGGFTHALNVAVQYASDQGFEVVAFQSLEVTMTKEVVQNLLDYFKNSDTLVVGPALQGHIFTAGANEIRGRTCPWNSFALWDVRKLQLTGFPLIGNGNKNLDISGGVEEVTAVSLLQYINPQWKAFLVDTSGFVEWDTNFTDPKRAEWHEKKMNSKDSRPAVQMRMLGIPSGKSIHVHMQS